MLFWSHGGNMLMKPVLCQSQRSQMDGCFLSGRLIINKMAERRQLSHNKSVKGDILNALPFIQQRKQSLSFEQQQRYFKHKISPGEISVTGPQDSQAYCPIKNQVSFLFHKDSKKSRIPLTPKKIGFRERHYETVEEGAVKRIMDVVSGEPTRKSPVQCDPKGNEKQLQLKAANERASNRAYLYQPFRKSTTNKDRLKPIIQNLNNFSDSDFLSVERLVLLDASSKKTHPVIVCEAEKERPTQHLRQKREGSVGRGRFNIERLKSLNNSLHEVQEKQESKELCSSIKAEKLQLNNNASNKALTADKRQQTLIIIENSKAMQQIINQNRRQSPPKRYRKQFTIPFETYYYRDLLWKVNFTNQLHIEVPLEYEHRLKVHVGRGNNSCMVAGLISRRIWFAFTDKPEEANFLWTQLKVIDFYKRQQSCTEPPLNPQQYQHQHHQQTYQPASLLTSKDIKQINSYMASCMSAEEHGDERMISRGKSFKYRKSIRAQDIRELRMQNHLINNYVLGNKKALFNTMANYYKETNQQVFDFLPLTFHITDGLEDKQYFEFLRYYHKRAKQINRSNQEKGKEKQYNAWIVKPGENSNRGNGIKMCLSLEEIKAVLKKRETYKDGTYRTYIVQAYIERPLLYCRRKFDLRHYIMMTCVNGLIKGYWYREGYVRTTSSEYSLQVSDGSIHLTNDAVQKNLPDYGKYEKGNKLSYEDLSAYIDKHHGKKGKGGFYDKIYPRMKRLATDAMRACSGGIDPGKLQNNFQVFGMDFMIDANLDVWLIQINSNPCLELSCPLLASLIPKMVENALQLTLDAIFPPPVRYSPKGLHYFKELEKENKFQLVYDERVQKLHTGSLEVLDKKLLQQEDDTFEDCGQEWEDN